MDQILISIGFTFGGAAIAYGLVLARTFVNAHVKNTQLNAWANGAISFAGQAYIDLVNLRQANPTSPLTNLITDVVKKQSVNFLASYQQTADKIGATEQDALSKIKGALGDKLSNDPTISVAEIMPALTIVKG